jgi:hypothetical protein
MKWKYQSRDPLGRVLRKLGMQYNPQGLEGSELSCEPVGSPLYRLPC